MTCFSTVENVIGDVFERLGFFIAKHPWKIIVSVLLMNGLFGIGMLKLEQDIDVSRVYTPMNSQATKDENIIKTLFPGNRNTDFYAQQVVADSRSATLILKPNIGNILDVSFLEEATKLHKSITLINATSDDGSFITFESICAKRSGNCFVTGSVILSPSFKTAVKASNVTYPLFNHINYESAITGLEVTASNLTKATFMKLTYNLRSDSIDQRVAVEHWQSEFLNYLETFSASEFDFAYSHSGSLSLELNVNIGGDIGLFSATFTLMITYACLATYSAKHDCIGKIS